METEKDKLECLLKDRNATHKDLRFGRKFWFGKYKGDYIYRVILVNPPYVKWLLNNTQFNLNDTEQWWFNHIQELSSQIYADKVIDLAVQHLSEFMPSDEECNPYAIIE